MQIIERMLRPRRILGSVSTFAVNIVKRRVTRRLNTNIWHPAYYRKIHGALLKLGYHLHPITRAQHPPSALLPRRSSAGSYFLAQFSEALS